jgi:NitT/TauT family transport system substrate-binding protein
MHRRFAVPLILAATATALVACAPTPAPAPSESAGSGELIPITFAALSVAQAAPLVYGDEQGIWEENGIDLTIEFVEPAAVVPGLLSGQYDVGYLNAPAVLAARSNGVPVQSIITMSVASGDTPDFPIQIVVPTGSDITSPQDLAGHKLATDTLFQLPDLGARGALADAGVDVAGLEIIEIPFADMGAALAEGRVDAAVISEPFGTILRNNDAVTDLLSTASGLPDGTPQSVAIASEEFIGKNADAVAAFQAAMIAVLEAAEANDADMRATLPTFTKLDAGLAGIIRFAPISSDDAPEGWQAWADILESNGVAENVDAESAYVPVG